MGLFRGKKLWTIPIVLVAAYYAVDHWLEIVYYSGKKS